MALPPLPDGASLPRFPALPRPPWWPPMCDAGPCCAPCGQWVPHRRRRDAGRYFARTWVCEGSADGESWVLFREHKGDDSLGAGRCTATWTLDGGGDMWGGLSEAARYRGVF